METGEPEKKVIVCFHFVPLFRIQRDTSICDNLAMVHGSWREEESLSTSIPL